MGGSRLAQNQIQEQTASQEQEQALCDSESEFDPDLLDQVRADTESIDPGPLAQDDLQRQLFKYIRRRAALEGELARVKEAMRAMLQAIQRQIDGLDHLYQPACAATVAQLLEGQRARSIKTPFGVAGFRKQPARLVVENEGELQAAWALSEIPTNCMKVEQITKPVMAVLNEWYERTGEIPAGCNVQPASDKFYVK